MMVAVAQDGKRREMLALDVECVPMWLATIDTDKVAEGSRGKLVRYQLECARVLRDHFMPKKAAAPANEEKESPGTAPVQARISDHTRCKRQLQAWIKTASKLTGRSSQSIQGELRKPWGVASAYRIPLVALEHTILQIQTLLKEHAMRKQLPAAPKKQAELPFSKPN